MEKKSVELFQDVSLMTLDSIMKCAFSFNSNCQTQRSVPEFPNPGKASAPFTAHFANTSFNLGLLIATPTIILELFMT